MLNSTVLIALKSNVNMQHKNAQTQPLYSEILSNSQLFVVPVVIVHNIST